MRVIEIPAKPKEKKKLRVAAYARVSADKDAAFNSFEAQKEYYENYIRANPDYELVGVYSDNAFSGTNPNRPEFQRMLEDCRAGKIDLIVSKSISRFARNTVLLLETLRELKELGIDCFFENENMHSISADGELMITLLACYAEDQARSASENILWRIQRKFENGEPWVGNMLGYRLIDGKMVIVSEEAEIVRRIFRDYMSGMGREMIAKNLTREGVMRESRKRWYGSAIGKILQNEKYKGELLLQKTYREDFRTKQPKINRGVRRMYRVQNSHEPIIPPEEFDSVQKEIERRREIFHKSREAGNLISGEKLIYSLFQKKIFCGTCGHFYSRKSKKSNVGKQYFWLCRGYVELGKTSCDARRIPEEILFEKTKEVLEIDELTEEKVDKKLSIIFVPERGILVFILKDDSSVTVEWENKSRSESWTKEMKAAAREKALKQCRN